MNKITRSGFEELKKQLEKLAQESKLLAEQLEYCRGLGDLKENADYHITREAKERVDSEISKIEGIIVNLVIIDKPPSGDRVEFGVEVTILDCNIDKKFVYKIVGDNEANILEGKISEKTPLVIAMNNKKKGDIFSFKTPSGQIKEFKIINIK